MRKLTLKDAELLNKQYRQAVKRVANHPKFAKHGKIASLLAEAYVMGRMDAGQGKTW